MASEELRLECKKFVAVANAFNADEIVAVVTSATKKNGDYM